MMESRRHTHKRCHICIEREIEISKARAEVEFLRRQFRYLRQKIDKLLAATVHSGGKKL